MSWLSNLLFYFLPFYYFIIMLQNNFANKNIGRKLAIKYEGNYYSEIEELKKRFFDAYDM